MMLIEKKLNKLVSIAVLLPAIGLIVFMFFQTLTGFIHGGMNFINLFFGSGGTGEAVPDFHTQALEWMQVVATIVILVKAYKILMSYVKTHHLSVKYLLEINFTASSLELLFNESSYDLEMKIIFLVLGLGSMLIYVLFPKQILELDKANHNK